MWVYARARSDPDNWLWAPMGVSTPSLALRRRRRGCDASVVDGLQWRVRALQVVDVHLPEKWGMLQFSVDPPNSTAPVRNDEWTVRT
jgi:hypothetical protein